MIFWLVTLLCIRRDFWTGLAENEIMRYLQMLLVPYESNTNQIIIYIKQNL